MKVDRQRVGIVDVLLPHGALVDEDGRAFCKTLLDCARGPNPRLVVEMPEVPYMDSEALEGLVTVCEELGERATDLRLARVNPTCREILELTGLADKFRFFQDVRDAVRSFL